MLLQAGPWDRRLASLSSTAKHAPYFSQKNELGQKPKHGHTSHIWRAPETRNGDPHGAAFVRAELRQGPSYDNAEVVDPG